MPYCTCCGKETEWTSKSGYCKECAANILNERKAIKRPARASSDPGVSPKSWTSVLLLDIFLGFFGVHRFYVGKAGTGVIWLLTAGCLGFGVLIDFIAILCGKFTDGRGDYVLSASMRAGRDLENTTEHQPSATAEYIDQLQRLAQLRDNGAITSDEYDAKKTVLLAKIG